jgi:hypothetical protein
MSRSTEVSSRTPLASWRKLAARDQVLHLARGYTEALGSLETATGIMTDGLLIAESRVARRAAATAAVDEAVQGGGYTSSTAKDQHQPASSRAMATVATTCRLWAGAHGVPAVVQPPVGPIATRLGSRSGELPASPHSPAHPVGRTVMPGRFDQQPTQMGVCRSW